MSTPTSETLGRCCYGGFRPKSACASCAAWPVNGELRTSNERIRSKCEHGVYGLMPDACGRCLVADRDRLRTALQACLDELLTLNKGIGWRDGEWSSIKMAREALAGCGSHETFVRQPAWGTQAATIPESGFCTTVQDGRPHELKAASPEQLSHCGAVWVQSVATCLKKPGHEGRHSDGPYSWEGDQSGGYRHSEKAGESR